MRLGVNDNYLEPPEESDELLVETDLSDDPDAPVQPRTRSAVKRRKAQMQLKAELQLDKMT